MSKLKQVQSKVDGLQANVNEALDNVQQTVSHVEAKAVEVVDDARSTVQNVVGKIRSFINLSGLTPRNLINSAKVFVGAKDKADPISLLFFKGLVTVKVVKAPSLGQVEAAVEANM